MLKDHVSNTEFKDPRIKMGSKIGEDTAVIDMGDCYLVAKTDPITFVSDAIGYYVVNVNVNDVVCTGATPKWFQSTILLPENKTDEDLIEDIFKEIHETCQTMNISVVGGHTEITSGLERPVVVGSLMGEVEKEKLVLTSGAQADDDLVLTKGIFIEGTSIIANAREDFLINRGCNTNFIDRCKNYIFNPGISVFKEASISNKNFKINSMHDITEGGLFCGAVEMGIASNKGVTIKEENVNILPEPLKLSKLFNLNPYGTISSGSLLISINKKYSSDLVQLLKKKNIESRIIGQFETENKNHSLIDNNNKSIPLYYSETDEITKIF
jgi:hydrogenase maturation factor